MYIPDISLLNIGDLSEAPCITDGYYYDDNGTITDEGHKDSARYYYPDYMVRDFCEDLKKYDEVIFTK